MSPRKLLSVLPTLLVAMTLGCGSSSVGTNASPSPAASPTMTTSDKAELAQLESRPLKLPTLLKGGVCRPDQQNVATGLWGADPVYLAGGSHTPNSFGDYYDVSADTKQGLRGPVLIRARDLKVANHPVVFVSDWGVGPIFGTDPDFGPQYTELALDTSHPPASVYPLNNQQYVEWSWRQGVAKGWTGCVGFQIDGKNFSEDINVNVTPG